MKNVIKYKSKEEVLEAMKHIGFYFDECATELLNDAELVLAVIKYDSWHFKYAAKELRSNKTFIVNALIEGVDPLDLIPFSSVEVQSDIEVMNLAVEKDELGWVYGFSKGEAALNKDLALAAIKHDSWNFKYAPKELKSNKTFIMNALIEGVDPLDLIPFSSVEVQSDIEVMNLAVEKDELGWVYDFSKGEAALNKELAIKSKTKKEEFWGR